MKNSLNIDTILYDKSYIKEDNMYVDCEESLINRAKRYNRMKMY